MDCADPSDDLLRRLEEKVTRLKGHHPEAECRSLFVEKTPENGVIRLARWPEGYVLWYHGQIVWRSWRAN